MAQSYESLKFLTKYNNTITFDLEVLKTCDW